MIVTYPRLPAAAAMTVLAELTQFRDIAELTDRANVTDVRADSYPTGAERSQDQLQELRDAVVKVASESGFPMRLATRGDAATNFDRDLSLVLRRQMDITAADAAQEGVWSFAGPITRGERTTSDSSANPATSSGDCGGGRTA